MLRLLTPGIGHSVLRIAATSGILAGAFALFQFGYLILTVDAVVKLILTFLYTHLHSEDKSTHTKAHDTLSGRSLLPQLEKDDLKEFEEVKEPLVRLDDLSLDDGAPDVIGCVVGWREDEELYARCLESLLGTPSCTTIVAGIDGDEVEDERMVDVFQKVSHIQALRPRPQTSCDCIPDVFLNSRSILMVSSFDLLSLCPRLWSI
jgi:hyaluronan synthase